MVTCRVWEGHVPALCRGHGGPTLPGAFLAPSLASDVPCQVLQLLGDKNSSGQRRWPRPRYSQEPCTWGDNCVTNGLLWLFSGFSSLQPRHVGRAGALGALHWALWFFFPFKWIRRDMFL